MPKIAPSILPADFIDLERDLRELKESGAEWIHPDIMGGNFVPNIAFGIPAVAGSAYFKAPDRREFVKLVQNSLM